MKILIDTHIFLWAIMGDPRLSGSRQKIFLDESNQLYLSIGSIWEMVIKINLGKITMPLPAIGYIMKQMEKNHIFPLAIHVSHLAELEGLPPLHRDPFDRILVAQARAEKMWLLSADAQVHKYDVSFL